MNPIKKREDDELRRRIDEELEAGLKGLLEEDKHWVKENKDYLYSLDIDDKRLWLSSVDAARQRYKLKYDHDTRTMARERRFFEKWCSYTGNTHQDSDQDSDQA